MTSALLLFLAEPVLRHLASVLIARIADALNESVESVLRWLAWVTA